MFSAQVTLEGLPESQQNDPPFRRVDVGDEPGVRTMAALLRAAWDCEPPAASLAAFAETNGDANADADSTNEAREQAVWAFSREYSHMSSEQKMALPRNPDTQDAFLPWRQTIYHIWRHVFSDTSSFVRACNARAGHWHEAQGFADLHSGDDNVGQLVLRHGQHGANAVRHVFKHNVLLCPAFFGAGISIRIERLPVNEHVELPTEDSDHAEDAPYVLYDRKDLDICRNDCGTIIWWIRRDVPVQFHVELDDETDDGSGDPEGLASVLVYGNLCVRCDLDAEERERQAVNGVAGKKQQMEKGEEKGE